MAPVKLSGFTIKLRRIAEPYDNIAISEAEQ